MMRYQRVSPDCVALTNGRKPTSISSSSSSTTYHSSFFDAAKPIKVRNGSGSANPTQQDSISQFPHFPSTSDHEIGCNGDVLLQWGHRKRSRGSRAENPNRTVGDESRQMIKIQRRAAIAGAERIAAVAAATTAAMPPPRGPTLRAFATGSHHNRNVEDRSVGQSRSDKRSPSSPPIKPHKNHHHPHNHKTTMPSANGSNSDAAASMNPRESKASPSDQETRGGRGEPSAAAAVEKVNLEHFEWPKIFISLSRKEKEDDFLAMKGTKLPQRPKKRAKNVDKNLQYVFPGMWLADLTKGRYEVREKKCVKKKRRGLKGMESMDSDSD